MSVSISLILPSVSPPLSKWHCIFQTLFIWLELVLAWRSLEGTLLWWLVSKKQEAGSRSFQPTKGYTQPHCPSATSGVIVKDSDANSESDSVEWCLTSDFQQVLHRLSTPRVWNYRVRKLEKKHWLLQLVLNRNPPLPFLVKPPFPFKDHRFPFWFHDCVKHSFVLGLYFLKEKSSLLSDWFKITKSN